MMVRECSRVLRPNGFLILSGPFFWPLHEEPYDFFRFTKYGFEQLLRSAEFLEWQIVEDGRGLGPINVEYFAAPQ